MKDWKKILVDPNESILHVIKLIDKTTLQIALVVDSGGRLMGTVTDGDVRRGILKGISLEHPVRSIMNSCPTVAGIKESRKNILALMKAKKLRHIPVVDSNGCVINVEFLENLLKPGQRENVVLLMAGGLGSRLRPLTDDCPKPLLKVGSKPILETILENFVDFGFNKFYISINYKGDMVRHYFADGSRWGVSIEYIQEDKRMGTAGALSLIPVKLNRPLVVMNGDLLTKINFDQLLSFHLEQCSMATMCVREYDFQVPYGVVKINRHRLAGIDEKPVQRFFVNAGIYVLDHTVVDFIPPDTYFDMPDLFKQLLEKNMETAVFPIREYWLDIGQAVDYEKANGEFPEVFG